MTRTTFAKGLFAAVLAVSTPGVALAMPGTAPAAATQAPIQDVAMGCGVGRQRDAKGRCRHRFNMFDHHDRRHFHHFRRNHCTMMRTPNGRVRRCRI